MPKFFNNKAVKWPLPHVALLLAASIISFFNNLNGIALVIGAAFCKGKNNYCNQP